MNIRHWVFILLCALHACPAHSAQPQQPRYIVRVLIDQIPDNTRHTWSFHTDQEHLVATWTPAAADEKDQPSRKKAHKKTIGITSHPDHLSVNGQSTHADRLFISGPEHTITYQNRPYRGVFEVRRHEHNWLLIHHVGLEEYVSCVVNAESWPGWPIEVNKVCAVLARTYVVEKMWSHLGKKKRPPFDIKATNAHQTYKGSHTSAAIQQATNETQSLIVAYDKKPIIAMYDACCGGIVPASIPGFNFKQAPYLARDYACTFCADCKIFAWKYVCTKKQLLKLLQNYIPGIARIDKIVAHRTSKSEYVASATIMSNKGKHTLTGKQLYSLCKDIKSFCYTITTSKDAVTIAGKGYGHHMGMCQWGARTMIKQGSDWKTTLRYYYPGVHFMKVVSDTKQQLS